jgi:hypothetical protein
LANFRDSGNKEAVETATTAGNLFEKLVGRASFGAVASELFDPTLARYSVRPSQTVSVNI